jgi:hypothetical protein
MAGDGRRDPVTVLGRAPVVPAQDQTAAIGTEPAVAARGVAAGEVAEQDELGSSRTESVKAQ